MRVWERGAGPHPWLRHRSLLPAGGLPRLGPERAEARVGSAGGNARGFAEDLTNRPSVHGRAGRNRAFDGVLAPEAAGPEQAQARCR